MIAWLSSIVSRCAILLTDYNFAMTSVLTTNNKLHDEDSEFQLSRGIKKNIYKLVRRSKRQLILLYDRLGVLLHLYLYIKTPLDNALSLSSMISDEFLRTSLSLQKPQLVFSRKVRHQSEISAIKVFAQSARLRIALCSSHHFSENYLVNIAIKTLKRK